MILPKIPLRIRAACMVLLVAMSPFLRSCGEVSYGFPLVAVEAGRPWVLKSFRLFYAALDILAVTALALAVYYLLRKKKDLLKGGMQGVAFYILCTWFGFIAVYPLSFLGDSSGAWGYITGIYLYFLYPFYAFTYDMHVLIPEAMEKSRFFGDADDIPLRIMYAVMVLAWFFLGYLRITIFRDRK